MEVGGMTERDDIRTEVSESGASGGLWSLDFC